MNDKFTVRQFHYRFPNDDACLEEIKILRYGSELECPKCKKVSKFYKIKGRKAYECSFCGFYLHPLAGTPFEKSSTPLTMWFYAIYIMTQTRAGISAKQLERMLGVTYKTAWRMFKQIRLLMDDGDGDMLSGTVEIDETYIGGVQKGFHGRKLNDNKTPVMGIVERKGRVRARTLKTVSTPTVVPPIRYHVKEGSTIMTDELNAYNVLDRLGYKHYAIKHSETYVQGNVHTNSVEGFWAIMKLGIRGVYRHVSPQYLQQYVNEYAFRYSHRNNPQMFDVVLQKMAR